MSTRLLDISQLNAFFGSKQVLFDVDLALAAGERLALVGESGSGKTVLAQALMRLNPDVRLSGSLKFAGQELLAATPKQLQQLRGKHIGMVFQEPMTALNPISRVGQQIAEVLTLHLGLTRQQAWQQALALLRETGIDEAAEKARAYPFQLSGGQRQRAMIAMAIAAQPQLLIADEPTTALDVAVQSQIIALLTRLQQQYGMALLYISHDLRLVRRFADSVAVMRHGRLMEHGSSTELFRQPKAAYTRELIEANTERLVAEAADTAATEPVLQAQQLAVTIQQKQGWWRQQDKPLLQPLSISLAPGQTLGVVGESGSGKTTLAKALLKLLAFSGSLNINGRDWTQLSGAALTAARRDIQMVFQDPFGAFNPRQTVLQLVGEGLRLHEPDLTEPEWTAQVVHMLAEVGLPEDILARYPHEFSGGQRQRLAIARALIVRPKILVLDEPTSALDVQLQKHILQLLADLQQKYRLSMILISHDLAVIHALAHQVLVLQGGQVVEYGHADQVFERPNAAYTQNLLQHRLT